MAEAHATRCEVAVTLTLNEREATILRDLLGRTTGPELYEAYSVLDDLGLAEAPEGALDSLKIDLG